MTAPGTLYLVPNGLDGGTAEAGVDLGERLPLGTLRVAARLADWVAENAKSTRAFLKRVDAVCPLAPADPGDRDRRIAAAGEGPAPTARPSTVTGCSRPRSAAAISA